VNVEVGAKMRKSRLDDNLTKWSVDARHNIQRTIHDLYRCSFAKEIETGERNRARAYHLMTAVGFALWRAAFLADERERSPREAIEHAGEFLRTILTTNNIGFADDRGAMDWASGHYINNAGFRLKWLADLVPTAVSDSKEFRSFLTGWPQEYDWKSTKGAWDIMHPALRRATDWIMVDLDVTATPATPNSN
jgi:hypothetical protein